MKKRTVIIGIDGVPFGLIDDLSTNGTMPYFEKLREEGEFTQMCSSLPEISPVAWTSITTGTNPGEHSVYGWTELAPKTYTLFFPHFRHVKEPPFWMREGVFCIIDVPFTYPPCAVNGLIVAGPLTPDLERAVYPPKYVDILKSFNYKIDINPKNARKSPDLLFKELFEALESRVQLCRWFWEKIEWDVLMLVITGSDRLGHFLWDAYEDETHEYYGKFLEYFTRVDEVINDIDSRLTENDSLIILSDHGMERITSNLNVNCYLEETGFLRRGKDLRMEYENIKPGTKAFALDPGRIYLNKKGKYPSGCVEPEEESTLVEELREAFEQLEINGEHVIKRVWHKDEIYHGAYTDSAPDLVLQPGKGFALKGNIFCENTFETDSLKGKHTQEDAFLYVRNESKIPENPSVEDVVSVLMTCMEWQNT